MLKVIAKGGPVLLRGMLKEGLELLKLFNSIEEEREWKQCDFLATFRHVISKAMA